MDNTAENQNVVIEEPEVIIVPSFVTEEDIKKIVIFLDGILIRLEQDPTVLGPSYVISKLKECRDYSNAIEKFLVKYYDTERRIKILLSGQKETLKVLRSEYLALNKWVRDGKSAADREARVEVKLKPQTEVMRQLQEELLNIQFVLKAIEMKRDGLNRTNNDIKKQVSLMEFAKGNALTLASDEIGFEDYDTNVNDIFKSLPVSEDSPEDVSNIQEHISDKISFTDELTEDVDAFLANLTIEDMKPVETEKLKPPIIEDDPINFEAFLNGR